MAYKMKGHSLPGPNQKKSPAKQREAGGTKSGKGNIFTKRGRKQRQLNKYAKERAFHIWPLTEEEARDKEGYHSSEGRNMNKEERERTFQKRTKKSPAKQGVKTSTIKEKAERNEKLSPWPGKREEPSPGGLKTSTIKERAERKEKNTAKRAGKKSPAKKKEYTTAQKKRVMELSKKHEDDPSFREYRDKVFGGKTTVKGSISTTRKPV